MVSEKNIEYSSLGAAADSLHKQGKRIVLATGVFDLLHRAHKQFLKKAKNVGDVLWVGIESDERVRQLKGQNRPHEPLSVRLEKVAQQPAVDRVFALPYDFNTPAAYEALVAVVRPHCFAVSSHTPHLDRKRSLVEKYGGKVLIVMEQDERISTTILLDKHKQKSGK